VVTRAVKISVWVIMYPTVTATQYRVHLFHGVPAGRFWRNEEPLFIHSDLDRAMGFARRLFGLNGDYDRYIKIERY